MASLSDGAASAKESGDVVGLGAADPDARGATGDRIRPLLHESQSGDSLMQRIPSEGSTSTYPDEHSEPPTPSDPVRRRRSADRTMMASGSLEEEEDLGDSSDFDSSVEEYNHKEQSSSYYYDLTDESCDDGSWRREVPLLRHGRKTRKQLRQKVEGLVQELQRRKKLFQTRQRDLALSVNENIRHRFLTNQERIVRRSRQMTTKLRSGRARAWRHKWVFALAQADFMVSAFWLGRKPETYYMYYTAQMALVIGCKVLDYRIKAQHYFLLDFCFFANACVLVWLWLFPTWGALYNACEGVCGLLAISIVVFRNSCVPHDFVRISNAYVHYPALLCMLSLKMQCQGDHCLGIEEGIAFRWHERLHAAFGAYLSWALCYSSVIFIFARNRIEHKKRDTLYKYFAQTLGYREALPTWLRPYAQVVFMCGHMTLFCFGVGWLLLPLSGQVIGMIVGMVAFFHNGGRFYVDHFWKAYERNTATYVDAAFSAMSKEESLPSAPAAGAAGSTAVANGKQVVASGGSPAAATYSADSKASVTQGGG